MEKHVKVKNKKIIIIVLIIVAIIAILIPITVKQIKINNAQKKLNNIRNAINNGITSDGSTSTSKETIDYINNSLVLKSAKVEEFDTYYNTKEWGLTDVKIKNNGDKSIKQVTVTVYFKDEGGNTIGENNINIGISDYYNTVSALKPNYEWASEKDHYYELKNLTENINPTRNEIKITNITFDK